MRLKGRRGVRDMASMAVDEERLRTLFEDENMTPGEIADELGTDFQRVQAALHRHGIVVMEGFYGDRGDNHGEAVIEGRRSKNATRYDRIMADGGEPRLFGQRPHLSKEGREIANAAAGKLERKQRRQGEIMPGDPNLADVLKFLTDNGGPETYQTATLCDLLERGLTFREAVTWYLFNHGGLTLREIYHVDEGKTRSASKERDRQAERNVASTLQSAANKLGIDLELDLDDDQ